MTRETANRRVGKVSLPRGPETAGKTTEDRILGKISVGSQAARTRSERSPARGANRSQKLVNVAVGDDPIFPYLVVRLIPGFYVNERIHVGPRPPAGRNQWSIVVVHPEPWKEGRLRPDVRQAVIDQVIARCLAQKTFRMCIVFGKDEQVYVEPDGTADVTRDQVPGMSMGLTADGELPDLGLPVTRLPDDGDTS